MKKIKTKIDSMNLSKYIACHLIGNEHTNTHRRLIGTVIIFTGVILIKVEFVSIFVVNCLQEVVGVLFHAVGAIPFVTVIESKRELNDHSKTIDI